MRTRILFALMLALPALEFMCSPTPSTSDGGADADAMPLTDASKDDTASEASCSSTVDFMTDSKNCGACGHDCLGGNCSSGTCEALVFENSEKSPTQLVVDATGAYWSNYGSNPPYGTKDGAIRFWANSSANPTSVTANAGPFYPVTVAVGSANFFFQTAGDFDSTHNLIGNGQLLECPLGGCTSSPTVVVKSIGSDAGQHSWGGMTQTATDYYWSQEDGYIYKASLAGGAAILFVAGSARVMIADSTNLYGLINTLDVWKAPLNGGPLQSMGLSKNGFFILAIAAYGSTLYALAENTQQQFDATPNGYTQLYSCALPNCATGLQPIEIQTGDGGTTQYLFGGAGLAANANGLYWNDWNSLVSDAGIGGIPQLMTCNPNACVPKPLMRATDTSNCSATLIGASDLAVYWLCWNGSTSTHLARIAL